MLAWSAAASAQDYTVKVTPQPAPPSAETAETAEGEEDAPPGVVGGYSWGSKPTGTKPRASKPVRRIQKQYDHNTPIVTYPGFRVLGDGTSVVWVTVSRSVPVRAERARGQASYFLEGAHVQVWNNTNPLLSSHFPTPVTRTRLRPGETGARLVIDLREDVEPTHEVIEGPRGTMLLRILVPPGKSAPTPASTPSEERPRENMAATAPDPEPAFAARAATDADASVSGSAQVEAGVSFGLSSKKKDRKQKKAERRRRRRK